MKRKPEMGASDLSDWRYLSSVKTNHQERILEALKICFPNCASVDLNELMKMAKWLEEDICIDATGDMDYLYKVNLKIENMMTSFQTTAAHSMQSQVGNQGQSQITLNNLQPQAPHQLLSQNVQNTGVQSFASLPSALPSVTTAAAGQSANMQPGRQQSRQIAPQLQQQPSQNQKQKQKQKQKLQHETVKQKLQRNMQQNQLLGQQNSIPDMQQQQRLVSQQNNMSNMQQQQSLSQQNNISNLHQQQLGPQNSAGAQSSASFPPALPSMTSLTQTSVPNAGLQQQQQHQQMLGTQSGVSNMQPHQQSMQIMHQPPKGKQQQHQQTSSSLLQTQGQHAQSQPTQQQLMSQHQTQQQPQNLLQPTQMQTSQQSHMQMSSGLQSSQPTLRQPQPYVLQSAPHSSLQQNQQSAAAQSSASFPPALPSMTSLTQTSVPNAAGQRINMQSGIGQNFVGQGLPSNFFSNTQLRIQLLQFSPMLQQRLLQSPLMNPQLLSSSMNSDVQTTEQNAVDWQEEIYQKIQSMKQNYLPPLNEIYRKISEECQQLNRNVSVLNVPECEKQKLLYVLKWLIQFLNVPKNSTVPALKEMFIAYEMQHTISGLNLPELEKENLIRLFENQMIHFPINFIVPAMKKALSFSENHIKHVINSNLPEEPVSTELQIQQPGGHPLSTQPQQQQQEEEEVDNQPDATHEIINVTDSSD